MYEFCDRDKEVDGYLESLRARRDRAAAGVLANAGS
jgi:hypothetical protein